MRPLVFHKVLTAILLGSCCCLGACENDVAEVQALGKRTPGVDEGQQIVSYLSMGGTLKARLNAPLMLRYQGDSALKTEFPKGLFVEFFNDSIRLESTLRARYGKYLEAENKVYLRDSVVVVRLNGDTLRTAELFWDQNQQLFFTDKFTTIIQKEPRQTLYAIKGFRSSQDLARITYFGLQEGSYIILPDSTLPTQQ